MYTEPVLTKEDFCKIIAMIQEQQKKISDFNDALDKICDGWPVFDTENKYLEALLLTLKEAIGDKYDYISWWLYETSDYKVYSADNKKVWDLKDPKVLYDYIINE